MGIGQIAPQDAGADLEALIASPRFAVDPYPALDRLRAERPVYWCEAWRCWFVTTYDDGARVLRDDEHLTNIGRPGFDVELEYGQEPTTPRTLLSADPPVHTRLRWVTIGSFTPQAIGALRQRIRDYVDGRLDALKPGEPVDVVTALAAPTATFGLATALGMPIEDLPAKMGEDFTLFSDDLGIPRASPFWKAYSAELEEARRQAGLTPDTSVADYVAARMDRPDAFVPESPLHKIQLARDAGEMSPDEASAYASMLIGSGTETTKILMTTSVGLLLSHPGELQRLRANPDWTPSAVEEVLRYEPPAMRIPRRAKTDFQLGGERIRANDIVMVMLGAANRDPARFPEPNRFLVDRFLRERTSHLTLSMGRHGCLGAHLARLEAEVLIEALLERFSTFELLHEALPWAPRYEFRYLAPRLVASFA